MRAFRLGVDFTQNRQRAFALFVLLGATLITACQTPHQRVVQHEDYLAAAGFVVRPANTPERKAMLARLPAHKFIKRENGDKVHYVYADPSVCQCLYVGSQKAYGRYQEDKQTRQQDKELKHELEANQHAAEDDDYEAQVYSDPAWSWGAWGTWGPEYGYGPGLGW